MTTTRRTGEFSTGHHNEQILYLRGYDRDHDLMVATFLKKGVASAISTVLNRHLEEVAQEMVKEAGSLQPGVPVMRLEGEPRVDPL